MIHVGETVLVDPDRMWCMTCTSLGQGRRRRPERVRARGLVGRDSGETQRRGTVIERSSERSNTVLQNKTHRKSG